MTLAGIDVLPPGWIVALTVLLYRIITVKILVSAVWVGYH